MARTYKELIKSGMDAVNAIYDVPEHDFGALAARHLAANTHFCAKHNAEIDAIYVSINAQVAALKEIYMPLLRAA